MQRFLTGLLLTVAVLLSGILLQRALHAPLGGARVDSLPLVPDVSLIGPNGAPRSLANWAGSTRLVFFGFSRCEGLTPLMLSALQDAYQQLTPAERQQAQVILVTVDPVRDSPAALRGYLQRYHPDFVGLTGTPEALARLRAGLSVHAFPEPDGHINHGDSLAVIDPRGRLQRVYFPQDLTGGVFRRDLPRLLRNGS